MDEILEKLNVLLYDAQKEKFHAGKEFERDNYKWCLGAKIAYEIYGNAEIFRSDFKEDKLLVYGIKAEIDFVNSKRIELWERVGSIDEY